MKDPKTPFCLQKRFQSFIYAFEGFTTLIREEHNARIHLFVTIIVIILGCLFNITKTEWLFIFISIMSVISFETINSAIENLADHTSLEKHPLIKKAKDLGAFAVLFAAINSLLIGGFIFIPYICHHFDS